MSRTVQQGGYTPLPRRFYQVAADVDGTAPPSQAAQMLVKQGGCIAEEAGTFYKMPGGEFSVVSARQLGGAACRCGADCLCRRGGRCRCGAGGCRCGAGRGDGGCGCGCGRGGRCRCGGGGCGGASQCGGGPVGAPLTTTCPCFKPLQYNFDPAEGTMWDPVEEGQTSGCSCAYSR